MADKETQTIVFKDITPENFAKIDDDQILLFDRSKTSVVVSLYNPTDQTLTFDITSNETVEEISKLDTLVNAIAPQKEASLFSRFLSWLGF